MNTLNPAFLGTNCTSSPPRSNLMSSQSPNSFVSIVDNKIDSQSVQASSISETNQFLFRESHLDDARVIESDNTTQAPSIVLASRSSISESSSAGKQLQSETILTPSQMAIGTPDSKKDKLRIKHRKRKPPKCVSEYPSELEEYSLLYTHLESNRKNLSSPESFVAAYSQQQLHLIARTNKLSIGNKKKIEVAEDILCKLVSSGLVFPRAIADIGCPPKGKSSKCKVGLEGSAFVGESSQKISSNFNSLQVQLPDSNINPLIVTRLLPPGEGYYRIPAKYFEFKVSTPVVIIVPEYQKFLDQHSILIEALTNTDTFRRHQRLCLDLFSSAQPSGCLRGTIVQISTCPAVAIQKIIESYGGQLSDSESLAALQAWRLLIIRRTFEKPISTDHRDQSWSSHREFQELFAVHTFAGDHTSTSVRGQVLMLANWRSEYLLSPQIFNNTVATKWKIGMCLKMSVVRRVLVACSKLSSESRDNIPCANETENTDASQRSNGPILVLRDEVIKLQGRVFEVRPNSVSNFSRSPYKCLHVAWYDELPEHLAAALLQEPSLALRTTIAADTSLDSRSKQSEDISLVTESSFRKQPQSDPTSTNSKTQRLKESSIKPNISSDPAVIPRRLWKLSQVIEILYMF
jgi:hypothetical protein